ncbi:MAG TPA: helix-turn-helix domain-containing protein, partial [Rectinemataceae bacterium]|nr:helix-turn-helix domain-containing protein [Rectinemataceae bacterium]
MEREHTREDMVRAVRHMQDYILLNVRDKISANDLARAAGYSVWHAQRMFRELTGQPPFEYIRRLRLSQAALVLRDKPSRVLDVALDFMFDSHEGFTRSFSKEFGVTPADYRRQPRPVKLFLPFPLPLRQKPEKGEERMNDSTSTTIFVQVIERPARKALIKRARKASDYFTYCDEVDCEIWGILASVKEALYEPVGLWLPAKFRPAGTSEYVQGVELPLDWKGIVPDGLELVDFGPAMMMVFQGEPYDDEDFQEAVGSMMEKIDKFDPTLYG